MYWSIPKPPISLGQTPGLLTFLKNFGQIPRDVASLDGQMPHPLELQRGSNPPNRIAYLGNKQNRLRLETSSAKFSATTNFLFSLSLLHALNKGIFHDTTQIKRQKFRKKTHMELTRAMTRQRSLRAESKNCEILLFPTADRRFDRKVKCPTGRASFVSNSPLYGA